MQDYKMFSRVVHPGQTIYASPDSSQIIVQNYDEAVEYLNAFYLADGYSVLSVDSLGEYVIDPSNPNSVRGLRFVWHLVKESKSSAKNDK